MGFNALNTARPFLSSFLQIDTLPVRKHPLVKKCLRGTYDIRTPIPKSNFARNISIVINFLLDFDCSSSVLNLSMKVAILFAVLNGQRAQEMSSVIKIEESYCIVRIGDLLKTPTAKHQPGEIIFQEYKGKQKICPVKNWKVYLEKTQSVRNGKNLLFLTMTVRFKTASVDTISHWIYLIYWIYRECNGSCKH